MMAYGAAAPALELLWSTGVLPVVLPHVHGSCQALGAPRVWATRDAGGGARRPRRPPPIAHRLLTDLDGQASPSRPLSPVQWATALLAQVAARRCGELAGEERWRGPGDDVHGRKRGRRAASEPASGDGGDPSTSSVTGGPDIPTAADVPTAADGPPRLDGPGDRAWIRAAIQAVAAARDELAVPCPVQGTLPCFPVGRAMLDAAERTLLHELSTRVEPPVGLSAKLRLARRDVGRAEPLLRVLRAPENGWVQATSPPWHAAGKGSRGAAASNPAQLGGGGSVPPPATSREEAAAVAAG